MAQLEGRCLIWESYFSTGNDEPQAHHIYAQDDEMLLQALQQQECQQQQSASIPVSMGTRSEEDR